MAKKRLGPGNQLLRTSGSIRPANTTRGACFHRGPYRFSAERALGFSPLPKSIGEIEGFSTKPGVFRQKILLF
jgi:hypothetical protein